MAKADRKEIFYMSKISKKDKRMLEKFRAYLIAERKNRVLPTDGMTEIPLKTGTLQIPKGAICVTTCKLRDADQAGVLYLGQDTAEYIVFLTDSKGLTDENCELACSAAALAISEPVDYKKVMIFGIVEEDISHYTYGLRIIRNER